MTPVVRDLINAYLLAVQDAVGLLRRSGIALPGTSLNWARDGPRSGMLDGGIRFVKHGIGVTLRCGGRSLDFDFGPNGETDGFDAWRLELFASSREHKGPPVSYGELDEALRSAEASGEVRRYEASSLYHLVRE